VTAVTVTLLRLLPSPNDNRNGHNEESKRRANRVDTFLQVSCDMTACEDLHPQAHHKARQRRPRPFPGGRFYRKYSEIQAETPPLPEIKDLNFKVLENLQPDVYEEKELRPCVLKVDAEVNGVKAILVLKLVNIFHAPSQNSNLNYISITDWTRMTTASTFVILITNLELLHASDIKGYARKVTCPCATVATTFRRTGGQSTPI
jgi:hypothetical protein